MKAIGGFSSGAFYFAAIIVFATRAVTDHFFSNIKQNVLAFLV